MSPVEEQQVSRLALPPLAVRLKSNVLQAPVFFLATAAFGTVSLLASLVDKSGRWQHAIAQRWAKTVLRISGSPVTVIGGEKLRRYPVAVYACNHLSYMDTPVIFSALPFQFRILARHNLWKLPFVGWHLNRSGQIPVNAENPRASVSSLTLGIKALKAGMPLFVFPEGGRSEDGHLATFMSGPAFMAIRAGVPLVPLALVGTYELLPMHARHFRSRPVKLIVGEPISTEGCTTKMAEELTARLREAIHTMYYEHASLEPGAPAEEAAENWR